MSLIILMNYKNDRINNIYRSIEYKYMYINNMINVKMYIK